MNKILILIFMSLLQFGTTQDLYLNSRLPKDFRPIHYELILQIDVPQKTFFGKVDILFKAPNNGIELERNLTRIELNSYKLNINYDTISLKEVGGRNVPLAAWGQYDDHEKFIINTINPLKYETSYSLLLEFSGDLLSPKHIGGLILSSYKNEDGNERCYWRHIPDIPSSVNQHKRKDSELLDSIENVTIVMKSVCYITNEYVIADFFPVYARRAFPCFDEPYFKATFNLSLGIPNGFSSVSTMPQFDEQGTSTKGEQINWKVFKPTPPLAPSSLAIMVSKLISVQNKTTNVTMWGPTKEIVAALAQQKWWNSVFEATKSLLTPDSDTILPEFHYVFLTDLHKEAFGSWGVVYIRANIPIYNLQLANEELKDFRKFYNLRINVAKEVVSQYFGDVVSPVWWDEVWLRDGISEYIAYLLIAQLEEALEFQKYMAGYVRPAVLEYHSKNGNAVVQKISSQSSEHLVKSITSQKSQKGAAILFMLMNAFGKETFQQGLLKLLKNKELSTVTTNDLTSSWQKQIGNQVLPCNLTIEKIVNTWLNIEGIPVVSIQRRKGSGNQTLVITQQNVSFRGHNFQTSGNASDSVQFDRYIPITYTTKTQKEFQNTKPHLWLLPHLVTNCTVDTQKMFNAVRQDDWIIFNIKGTGLYRVLYDNYYWKLIAEQLKEDLTVIDELNRAQIVDDAFALAWNGRLSYSTALYVAEYLDQETSVYPLLAAYNALKTLKLILSQHDEARKNLTEYIKPIIENVYNNMGFYSQVNEGLWQIFFRAETLQWACDLGIHECIQNATTTMQEILSNTFTSHIKGDYLEPIFCGGLQNADNNTWAKVFNLYNEKHDFINTNYLLYALGCCKNKQIIERYLNVIITPRALIKEEVQIIFHSLIKRPEHINVAASFFVTNAASIEKIYGTETLLYLISILGEYLTSQSQFDQLKSIESQDISRDSLTAVNNSLIRISSSINWLDTFIPQIKSYFNKKCLTENSITGNVSSTLAVQTTPLPSSSPYIVHNDIDIIICLILLIKFYFL